MSVTHTPSDQKQPTAMRCSHCNAILPPHATFCGSCGERVDKHASTTPSIKRGDIAERYRITSLIHRHTQVQLFFAQDNQTHNPMVIRDIDLSPLDEAAQDHALEAAQQEYELLRRKHIPDVTPVADLRFFEDHLYLVESWPFTSPEKTHQTRRGQTLHDLLQSGAGLPDEDTAISWTYRVSRAVERLHNQNIVLGDLDPHSILIDGNSYDGLPALIVSWLPAAIRKLFDDTTVIASKSPFNAPETRKGQRDRKSDVYSLGAILYLLLTGFAPGEQAQRKKANSNSPREINPRVSTKVDEVVQKALTHDPIKRFHSAKELSEILLDLSSSTRPARPVKNTSRLSRKRAQQEATTQQPTVKRPAPQKTDSNSQQPTSSAEQTRTADAEKTLIIRKDDKATIVTNSTSTSHQLVPGEDAQATVAIPAVNLKPAALQKQPTSTSQAIEDVETQEVSASGVSDKTVSMPAVRPTTTRDTIAAQPTQMLNITPAPHVPHVAPPTSSIQAGKPAIANTTAPTTTEQGADSAHKLLPDFKSLIPATNALPAKIKENQFMQRVRDRVNGRFLPAISHMVRSLSTQTRESSNRHPVLQQLQHFVLGVQRRDIAAAALIETPLRIQPDQNYTLRISLMGRDEPHALDDASPDAPLSGLSALAAGDIVHIEVRTTLVQRFAFVVQKADVLVPKKGYAAEITIPMQPFENSVAGRRERLYLYFTDEFRNPLYEQPFAVEIFVSPLVQAGREGHDVLTIPF